MYLHFAATGRQKSSTSYNLQASYVSAVREVLSSEALCTGSPLFAIEGHDGAGSRSCWLTARQPDAKLGLEMVKERQKTTERGKCYVQCPSWGLYFLNCAERLIFHNVVMTYRIPT